MSITYGRWRYCAALNMVNKKEILKSNPVAKELRTVKFRSQKIKNKKKSEEMKRIKVKL